MLKRGEVFPQEKKEAAKYFLMLKDGDKSEAFSYFKMALIRGSDRDMNTFAAMLRDGIVTDNIDNN